MWQDLTKGTWQDFARCDKGDMARFGKVWQDLTRGAMARFGKIWQDMTRGTWQDLARFDKF